MDRTAQPAIGNGVDWKTLFLGACSLIVIFGGGMLGIWSNTIARDLERERVSNIAQWERIIKLEADNVERTIEHKHMQRQLNEYSEHIEATDEHPPKRMHRGQQ